MRQRDRCARPTSGVGYNTWASQTQLGGKGNRALGQPTVPSSATQRSLQGHGSAPAGSRKLESEQITISQLLEAIRLLVAQPLRQLQASLGSADKDDDDVTAAGLCSLRAFIQRLLAALHELRRAGSQLLAGGQPAEVALHWTAAACEELSLWSQCAGKALRGLAASAAMAAGGAASSLNMANDEVLALRQELGHEEVAMAEEQRCCRELQEFQRFLSHEEALTRQEQHLCHEFGEFMRSCMQEDVEASGRQPSSALMRSRAVLQQSGSLWPLAELCATQASQHRAQVEVLNEYIGGAVHELQCVEGAAELAKAQALLECRQLDSVHRDSLRELQHERRQHKVLEQALHEANCAAIQRERIIREEVLSQPRHRQGECTQTMATPPLFPGTPEVFKAAVADASTAEPEPSISDVASVCRVSTESTQHRPKAVARRVVASVPPSRTGSKVGDRGVAAMRPWELPPEQFLDLWRQSRGSCSDQGLEGGATGSTEASTATGRVAGACGSSASGTEALWITTSFE